MLLKLKQSPQNQLAMSDLNTFTFNPCGNHLTDLRRLCTIWISCGWLTIWTCVDRKPARDMTLIPC
uniref:Uncharacterized protein n=1 Tax=Cannabis sativa TaxID=3483 RepID=A0A803R9F0_CANSA